MARVQPHQRRAVLAAARRCSARSCATSGSFDGFVVSDCWAIKDFHENHKVTATWEESAAMAVKAGCDLNCGCTYEHIPAAVAQGLLAEADVDVVRQAPVHGAHAPRHVRSAGARAVRRDPVRGQRLRRAPRAGAHRGARVDRAAQERRRPAAAAQGPPQHRGHRPQRLRPARAGRQLLRHAVARGDAARRHPRRRLARGPRSGTRTAASCRGRRPTAWGAPATCRRRSASRSAPTWSCCAWACRPTSRASRATPATRRPPATRSTCKLPGLQQRLLEMIVALGKPTVLCVLAGSALDLTLGARQRRRRSCTPGTRAAKAARRSPSVLFGDVIPAGRLPITFPRSLDDVPSFTQLRDEGPHLPLPGEGAALPLRLRPVVHALRVPRHRGVAAGRSVRRRRRPSRASPPSSRTSASAPATRSSSST